MKTGTLVSILIIVLVVALAAIFIFISCNNGGVTPTIVGTWVDPDGGKAVATDNGDGTFTMESYDSVSDTVPSVTLIMTLTDEWTDSEGNRFYKMEGPYPDPEYAYYLFKIHADNQTAEINISHDDYPTEIDPYGEDYVIMYRQ